LLCRASTNPEAGAWLLGAAVHHQAIPAALGPEDAHVEREHALVTAWYGA